MPIMIPLTSADHGGHTTCGPSGHGECGTNCTCGCPYIGIEEKGHIELIATVEQRYPDEWLAFVIPAGEDEFAPERGMLVVHSADDEEVWEAVKQITYNQIVHVYFNGPLEPYLEWAACAPASAAPAPAPRP